MAEKQNVPAWLERALDPTTPSTEANETVRTANNYFEDIGAEIIYPTIRMGEDGKLYRPEDPMEEAIKNNDYIVVEGPPNRETAERAMQISKQISAAINQSRTKVDATDKGIAAQEKRMTSDTVSFAKGGMGLAQEIIKEEMPYALSEGPLNRERVLMKAQEADPEGLGLMQDVNTEDKADWLNISQFYTDDYVEKSPLPIQKLDKFLLENAAYSINVPFGTEESSVITSGRRGGRANEILKGQKTGYKEDDLMIDLPGEDKNPFVVMHESAHAENPEDKPRSILESLSKTFKDTIISLGHPVGKSGKPAEEAAVTSLDLYRSLHRKDATGIANSLDYLTRQYDKRTMSSGEDVPDFTTPEGLEQLADNAVAYTLSIIDETDLYSDEEKQTLASDIKQSFKDNEDTIIAVANSIRKMYDTGDSSQLRMYIDALEDEYTKPQMNDGGLMTDPLVLSETAEEEAAPTMGIGEYIEGVKEVAFDFSPEGTAQSMIDAAEEAYKLASGAEDASLMDFGIAAIGALPGGKTATKAVETAAKLTDDVVEASQNISKLDNYVPKSTVTAYKLVKEKNGKFYPLFVSQGKEKSDFPVGEWIKAEAGELSPKGKVKSSIGELAYRPGFHAGDLPIATHIGGKSSKSATKPDYRPDDQVWVEIEMANDVDWGSEALKRAQKTKDGRIKSVTAHITDMVPHGGHYRYKTNPNMTGEWLIGGEMKVTRVLSDDEVKKINEAAGVSDLPRKSELSGGGLMLDDYNRAES